MGPESNFWNCNEVNQRCPVQETVLSYRPNFAINAFLAVVFGLCALAQVVTGVWKKTWAYSAFLALGCILEFVGYLERLMLSNNPWDGSAFQAQICCIILGPTVICISLYLTLKHITLAVDPSLSRIRPALYPLVFVPADVSCLVLQGVGGGIAVGAHWTNTTMLNLGNGLILTGISLQCVLLAVFGLSCLDYYLSVRKRMTAGEPNPLTYPAWDDGWFRLFCYALLGAYIGIFVRCLYRIAEMAHGWGNPIMQDEPSFIILEGFMVLLPVLLLTIFPAGCLFPAMVKRREANYTNNMGKPVPLATMQPSGPRRFHFAT